MPVSKRSISNEFIFLLNKSENKNPFQPRRVRRLANPLPRLRPSPPERPKSSEHNCFPIAIKIFQNSVFKFYRQVHFIEFRGSGQSSENIQSVTIQLNSLNFLISFSLLFFGRPPLYTTLSRGARRKRRGEKGASKFDCSLLLFPQSSVSLNCSHSLVDQRSERALEFERVRLSPFFFVFRISSNSHFFLSLSNFFLAQRYPNSSQKSLSAYLRMANILRALSVPHLLSPG